MLFWESGGLKMKVKELENICNIRQDTQGETHDRSKILKGVTEHGRSRGAIYK